MYAPDIIFFFAVCLSTGFVRPNRNAAPSLPSEQRAGDGDVRYSVLMKCMHACIRNMHSTSQHLVVLELNITNSMKSNVSSADSIIVEKYTNFWSSNLERTYALEYAIVGGTGGLRGERRMCVQRETLQ